jgi:hypothetical protein
LSFLARCSTTSYSRAFTSSTRLSAIGPESPKFIEIPVPPQRQARGSRDIKGILPPPRDVFDTRGLDKTTPDFLAATTPEPKELPETEDDRIIWKRRMAAKRRANLREGILELYERKKRQEVIVAKRSAWKVRDREKRLKAPQREDERLTNPTITAATRTLQSGPVPDPDREARLAEKAERVKAKEALKAAQRKDALHTLYMNAREFITTEEQLDAEIEKIFVPYPFGENNEGKTNIWDAYGAPPTVQDMLSAVNNTQKLAIDFHRGPGAITGKRMKRIAEELTGGKMD